MSDHHNETDTGPIKTRKHLLIAFFFVFVVPATIIIGLGSGLTVLNTTTKADQQAVAERIQKVGTVALQEVRGEPRTGEEVFKAQCTTCHSVGALGSPKFGDAGAWAPRIAKGFDALLNSALHGKGNMPAQGGGAFSDFEVARGLVYMANSSGGHLAEPKAPAENKK
jgi:cytochrome c5